MAVGRIAIQFNKGASSDENITGTYGTSEYRKTAATKGWLDTGNLFDVNMGYLLPDGSTRVRIPDSAWGEVDEYQFGVDREYGGIGSSGGPQHTGRADQRFLVLRRVTDQISPQVFKLGWNGYQMRRIVILDNQYNMNIMVVAENCNVVQYISSEVKKNTTSYNIQLQGELPSLEVAGYGMSANQSLGTNTRTELITIIYTKLSMKVGASDFSGWDVGTESSWNDTGYTLK